MATETRDVAVIDATPTSMETRRPPAQILADATEQANVLMKVVKDKKLYALIGDKEYLNAQAWETILAFNNAHPIVRFVEQLKDGNQCIGYRAQVDIYQNGDVISSGIMSCGFEEYPCRGKEGIAKHRAAESSAQTWALSKAARQKFAWVAVLAGFEPTPAEEMDSHETRQSADNPYWCREHKTLWFKKGKMTSFGHPVDGSKEWCHMPKQPVPHQVDTQTGEVTDAPEDNRPSPNTSEVGEESQLPANNSDGQLAYYDELFAQAKVDKLPDTWPLSNQARQEPMKVAAAIKKLEGKLATKGQQQ